MTITLSPELEAALKEHAQRLGISPETLVLNALRERFAPSVPPVEARDEWERSVLEIGTNCGTALSDEALSSEGLY